MARLWKTQYPLPEHMARQLRRSRWLFAGMTVVFAAGFVLNLAKGSTGWQLWFDGLALLMFAGFSLLAIRQLRRHDEASLHESTVQPPPS